MDDERRAHARYASEISVDYASGDTFLFSYIENISMMGIFIRSEAPLPIGTELMLRLGPEQGMIELRGEVAWINPVRDDGGGINPGMGVRFIELTPDQREQIVSLVRTVAYLSDELN